MQIITTNYCCIFYTTPDGQHVETRSVLKQNPFPNTRYLYFDGVFFLSTESAYFDFSIPIHIPCASSSSATYFDLPDSYVADRDSRAV